MPPMNPISRILTPCGIGIAMAALAVAADPPTAPPADARPQPSVVPVDGGGFRIGAVTFDPATREVRLPAIVNMDQGLIEFLVVHQGGKIHESLFVTDASPTDFNLAFTLLGFKPSPELYPLPSKTGGLSDQYPQVPAETRKGARLRIDVEHESNGTIKRLSVNDWIQHAVREAAMPAGSWVYGGSRVSNGRFAAETTGDIVAIYLSLAAIFNYPGDDNDDDDVWIPYPGRIPEPGTKVTLVFSPDPNPTLPADP